MTNIIFRLYLIANLVMLAVVLYHSVAEDPTVIAPIMAFSLLASLPVIPFLFLLFWFIDRLPKSSYIRWMVLVPAYGACAAIPAVFTSMIIGMFSTILLQVSMIAAFIALLLQLLPIHKFLMQHHEIPAKEI